MNSVLLYFFSFGFWCVIMVFLIVNLCRLNLWVSDVSLWWFGWYSLIYVMVLFCLESLV